MTDKKVLQKKFKEGNYKYNAELFEEIKEKLIDKKYIKNNEILVNIMKKFPVNTEEVLTEVYAKVLIINITNSAGVRNKDYYEIAETIAKFKDLDRRLKEGDIKVVSELNDAIFKKIKRNSISFCSKYCFYHNNNDFSKFDNVVCDYVRKYVYPRRKQLGWKFNGGINREHYKNYYNAIGKIIEEDHFPDRTTFDTFIWGLYRKDGKKE